MASGDLSMTSNSSQEENPEYGGYNTSDNRNMCSVPGMVPGQNNGNNSSNLNTNQASNKHFEIIKKYETAIIELNALRRQYAETVRRCDDMSSRLETYKHRYDEERIKYADVTNENARLAEQNILLERKLRRFKQQQEEENGNTLSSTQQQQSLSHQQFSLFYGGGGGSLNSSGNDTSTLNMGNNNVQKCDGSCFQKYGKIIEEAHMCKKLYSDLSKDCQNISAERDALQVRLQAALSDSKNAKFDYEIFRETKNQLISQQEKEIDEIRVLMDARAKELKMTKVHLGNLEEELNLIQSEKDNVLQEHQKMSEDLEATKKELQQKVVEQQDLILRNEKLQQSNMDLNKKLEQSTSLLEKRELLMKSHNNSSWSKEFPNTSDTSITKDESSKEIDKLRKSLERARSEVEKAVQETNIAKSRRDLAISEREKIVKERESVKKHCDDLRRERDEAVSKYLSAIVDSEEIKKQKDEAFRKIDSLKEQVVELQHNQSSTISSARRQSFRWSSYESDDVLEVELNNFHLDDTDDLGIILDDTNNRQLVCGVTPNSPAFGKLKINDVILKVNELDCQSISKHMVLEAIRSATRCTLLVSRTKQSKRNLYTVHINLHDTNRNHGISLDTGVFISKIEQNSLASFEPELDCGDRILSINNKSMQGIQFVKDVQKILDDPRNESITIVALKNIQDVGGYSTNDVHHIHHHYHRRMTNTSAQTDSNDSVHKITAATSTKQPSKLSEMINKFRERIHISKSGSGNPDSDPHLQRENEVLHELDSVISENSNYEKSKRNKRNKKEKDSSKSMGTWPRAAILLNSSENPTGTIVQTRKKERAPLSIFSGGDNTISNSANATLAKQNPNRLSNPIPSNLFQPAIQQQQQQPPHNYLNRHSLYVDGEQMMLNPQVTKLSGANNFNQNLRLKMSDKYGTNQRYSSSQTYHNNRLSLNLTPTELIYKSGGQVAQQQHQKHQQQQQQQQFFQQNQTLDFIPKKQHHLLENSGAQPQSIQHLKVAFPSPSVEFKTNNNYGHQPQSSSDMISLKSQNSIDSFFMQQNRAATDYSMGTNNYPKRQPQRNVSKYPSSDGGESLGMETTLTNQNGPQSLFFPTGQRHGVSPFSHLSSSQQQQQYKVHHSSPLTLPVSSLSIENPINSNSGPINSSSDKFDLDYPNHQSNVAGGHHHTFNPNIYNRNRGSSLMPTRDHEDLLVGSGNQYHLHHGYESGTVPRRKENQRFRIPSNQSVTSKGSGVSIDHNHGSESPMPSIQVDMISSGSGNKHNPDFLCPGDLRRITIDKSEKALGIEIDGNKYGGGIFVCTVTEKSIASRAGLRIGDQLLEVCGINLRAVEYSIATNVLKHFKNSITMLVQYNPEKYYGHSHHNTEPINHSGSPTPRNSPRPPAKLSISSQQSPPPSVSLSFQSNAANNSQIQNQTLIKHQKFSDSLENQSNNEGSSDSMYEEDPRLITIYTHKCKNLGIKLFGGNKVGIFVHDVISDSPADLSGIRKGDQILEYNDVNLRNVTAEQAANEISKLTDTVTMLVQNNLQKLNLIQDQTGDSFYIRVGFDRTGELGEGELRFNKDEVLYVDNTIFRGSFGQWRAWKLDAYGEKKECGIIPSQAKVEEDFRLLGDSVDCDGGTTRRGSTSARRSFFRRKKHQRSSSRDSKELASFSNTQLSYFSDSGMLNDDGGILSYQRVERLEYPAFRPILVLGPLAEYVTDRLTNDFNSLFKRCITTTMNCSEEAMGEGLQKNIFVDYRKKGNLFECVTIESIRNICKNNRHCVLDNICISAVERLHRLQIYPIVLLLRFKSTRQIREIKDSRYSTDKISPKAAKEMYERASKLESDYKQYISAIIQAGVNITHMSTQVKGAVLEEQSKVLFISASN